MSIQAKNTHRSIADWRYLITYISVSIESTKHITWSFNVAGDQSTERTEVYKFAGTN